MVTRTVHPVGEADRRRGPSRFQAGESGGIVDHIVGNQNLLPPAGLEIASGGVVETAKDADAGEEQDVRAVPEGVWCWRWKIGLRSGRRPSCRLAGFHLSGRLLAYSDRDYQEAAGEDQGENARETKGHSCIVAGNNRENAPVETRR